MRYRTPVNIPVGPSTGPVLGLYWAESGSIGPVQARYWQLTACLHGITNQFTPNQTFSPDCARTGPVLVRCWQHKPSTGPVLACLQGRFYWFSHVLSNIQSGLNVRHQALMPFLSNLSPRAQRSASRITSNYYHYAQQIHRSYVNVELL